MSNDVALPAIPGEQTCSIHDPGGVSTLTHLVARFFMRPWRERMVMTRHRCRKHSVAACHGAVGLHRGGTSRAPALGYAPRPWLGLPLAFPCEDTLAVRALVTALCLASLIAPRKRTRPSMRSRRSRDNFGCTVASGSAVPSADALVVPTLGIRFRSALGVWMPPPTPGSTIPHADTSVKPALGIGSRFTPLAPPSVPLDVPCDGHARPPTAPKSCADTCGHAPTQMWPTPATTGLPLPQFGRTHPHGLGPLSSNTSRIWSNPAQAVDRNPSLAEDTPHPHSSHGPKPEHCR